MAKPKRDLSWWDRLWIRKGGEAKAGYGAFREELIQRFASPEPEAEALRKLVVSLAGFSSGHLPRDKAQWLELVVDSPYLSGPLGVYADEFAGVAYEVLQPRGSDLAVGRNARLAASMPSGMRRHDLVDDLKASGELVPADPSLGLYHILGPNIRKWTGRRLRRMTMLHYAAVGEGFWHLGRVGSDKWATEALTVVPTDVLMTPTPDRDYYRLAQHADNVAPEDVFEWSQADPRNIYSRGRGLVQALGDEAESAEWMSRLLGTFMRNDNTPRWLWVYRGHESAEDTERRLDRKHRGMRRFFRPLIQRIDPGTSMTGSVRDAFAIEKLGEPLDPTKVMEYSRWAWEFCRQYLRIPPSMLANYDDNSGLGMSGVELERAVFLMSVMTPLVLDFEDCLQDLARREYDDRLVVRHLPFVETDREFRLRVAEKFEDRFQNDELRAIGGWGSMEDEESGRSYMVRRGRIPAADLRPGNEALEAAARGGSRRDDSSNALPAESNGHKPSLTPRQKAQTLALPGQVSDMERRLAVVSEQLERQSLRR